MVPNGGQVFLGRFDSFKSFNHFEVFLAANRKTPPISHCLKGTHFRKNVLQVKEMISKHLLVCTMENK